MWAGQARQKVTLKVHYAGGGASTATRSPPLGLDTALATANINAASMRDADFVSGKPSADATDVEHSLRASEALQFPLKDVALDWRDTTTGSSNPHSVVVGKSQALSPPQEQSQKSTAPLGGEQRHIMLWSLYHHALVPVPSSSSLCTIIHVSLDPRELLERGQDSEELFHFHV